MHWTLIIFALGVTGVAGSGSQPSIAFMQNFPTEASCKTARNKIVKESTPPLSIQAACVEVKGAGHKH